MLVLKLVLGSWSLGLQTPCSLPAGRQGNQAKSSANIIDILPKGIVNVQFENFAREQYLESEIFLFDLTLNCAKIIKPLAY